MGLSTVITKHILMSRTLSLYVRVMVENSEIEPVTSCMPCKRSPGCIGYIPPQTGQKQRFNTRGKQLMNVNKKQINRRFPCFQLYDLYTQSFFPSQLLGRISYRF